MTSRPHAFLVPGLPPGRELDEILDLTRLVADLSRYAAGRPPSADELDAAPLIEDWTPVIDTTALRLSGTVRGHPIVRGPLAVTSRVCAIDPGGRWIRTHSRLWRTGSPMRSPLRS